MRLVVCPSRECSYEYVLTFVDHDGDGLTLGDGRVDPMAAKEPKGELDWQVWIAERTAAEMADRRVDGGQFRWESKAAAASALRVIKARWKARKDARPLPDWAVKATAAGWKAPKGWKP